MSEFRIRIPSPVALNRRLSSQTTSSSSSPTSPSPSISLSSPTNSEATKTIMKIKLSPPKFKRKSSSSLSSAKKLKWSTDTLKVLDLCNQNIVQKYDYHLIGLDSQKEELFEFLKSTVEGQESTSVFVLGPHGSGKTLLINTVLDELSKEHEFHKIELSGLLYLDEKSAFKGLAQKLRLLDDFDEESTSLSDTQLLFWLMERFKSKTQSILPWVIILDVCEGFTQHTRQSFLYALFDATQSSTLPLAVIGVSTCLDLPTMLEKRVKSRYSQRFVSTFSNTLSPSSSSSSSSSTPSLLDFSKSLYLNHPITHTPTFNQLLPPDVLDRRDLHRLFLNHSLPLSMDTPSNPKFHGHPDFNGIQWTYLHLCIFIAVGHASTVHSIYHWYHTSPFPKPTSWPFTWSLYLHLLKDLIRVGWIRIGISTRSHGGSGYSDGIGPMVKAIPMLGQLTLFDSTPPSLSSSVLSSGNERIVYGVSAHGLRQCLEKFPEWNSKLAPWIRHPGVVIEAE